MNKRLRIEITGRVQGVGFRPSVFRHAAATGVGGSVRNAVSGVTVEAEGAEAGLAEFVRLVRENSPVQSRIDGFNVSEIPPQGSGRFEILASRRSEDPVTGMPPDLALCEKCRQELLNPSDRRFRYPFINCTDCGPRFTIIRSLPYDREETSMAPFAMCPACAAEYADPGNRRFDAQPDACPACGPRVSLLGAAGRVLEAADPIREAAVGIKQGRIAAVKGLGGYHLACDASNDAAVLLLRLRKNRPHKALAVMFAGLEALEQYCETDERERKELLSSGRPVVVLKRKNRAGLSSHLSPDTVDIGAMLPYTPLHELLSRECGPLVMTSANRAEEPIVMDEPGLSSILGPIADCALVHDRAIVRRADDSVVAFYQGQRLFIRRSRGFVPDPLPLSPDGPPVLALGAGMKNTFCAARAGRAFMSQHIGDLDDYEAYEFYRKSIGDFLSLLKITPEIVAHDLHPDYPSTRFASFFNGCRKVAVQHHHAHIASCLCEHDITGPAIGVALDGAGLGGDGTLWGGEFLAADCARYERAGHFKTYPLPGGDQAVRHPLRFAFSVCVSELGEGAGLLDDTRFAAIPENQKEILRVMLKSGLRSPLTSSAGRLFDAVSALLGLCDEASYEGQAAVRLETLARKTTAQGCYPFDLDRSLSPAVLSFGPMIRELLADLRRKVEPAEVAALFHNTIAEGVAAMCLFLRDRSGLNRVVLSGGVFQNRLLLDLAVKKLMQKGFAVLWNTKVSPNDSGIALGQAAVARATGAK